MRIGVLGGTGKLGSALAARLARAGHAIFLGSRDRDKAHARAAELARERGGTFAGGDHAWAVAQADLAILTVPYSAHADTLRGLEAPLSGKVLVDTTVPLRPPRVNLVQLPAGRAAALEAQQILGEATPVAAAFHHVSAAHLADPAHPIDCDVLVAADDPRARDAALALARDIGLRGLDAGPLANAIALESMTAVLIHLNRTYKSAGAGVVITNLGEGGGR